METKLTPTPTRDSFVEWIDKRLTGLNFCKSEDSEMWSLERDVQTAGQTMIINGQRMDQPGQVRHLKFQVEIFGDGEVKDVSAERIDPFVEINFYVFENDSRISEWPTFCVFFDDNLLFDSLLNKFFRL